MLTTQSGAAQLLLDLHQQVGAAGERLRAARGAQQRDGLAEACARLEVLEASHRDARRQAPA